jgi:hypothetical protein
VRMWTGFMWFRVGTSNMLCTREWADRIHKLQGISSFSEPLLASQEGICSMELVTTQIFLPTADKCTELLMMLAHELHNQTSGEMLGRNCAKTSARNNKWCWN